VGGGGGGGGGGGCPRCKLRLCRQSKYVLLRTNTELIQSLWKKAKYYVHANSKSYVSDVGFLQAIQSLG